MAENLLAFTGKVDLVTGGATGIGRATSLAFARQGATVVIGDIDGRAEETVGLIEKAGGGAIVNTASMAGVIADPGMAPYVAAKHGVIGLTKAAALDYAKAGVRVNALPPGLVATGMTKGWPDYPAMRDVVMAGSQLGRPAEPEEIAGMVLYLSSDLASFATAAATSSTAAKPPTDHRRRNKPTAPPPLHPRSLQ